VGKIGHEDWLPSIRLVPKKCTEPNKGIIEFGNIIFNDINLGKLAFA
jgi:hypothetical protein